MELCTLTNGLGGCGPSMLLDTWLFCGWRMRRWPRLLGNGVRVGAVCAGPGTHACAGKLSRCPVIDGRGVGASDRSCDES